MRTLAIDCATEACSVALFDGVQLVSGAFAMLGRGHAERLVPMIAQLPARGEADRIAVALGPGSFTGIRVGLAAARALALAWNAALVGYPTLALQAAQARDLLGAVPLTVCNRAGHGEWFVQIFDAQGAAADAPRSLAPPDALALARSDHIVGTQAEALVARAGRGTAHPLWPDARCLAMLPEQGLRSDVRPIYGRGPDAVPQGAR